MKSFKKFVRFFLGIPVTILAFLFISKVFFDNRNVIINSLLTLNPLLFLLGLLFFAIFFMIKSFVWIEILKKRGYAPPKRSTIYLYSISEVKRYIPGSIFAFIGRANSLSDHIPGKETLKGIGIEAILLVLSALVLCIPAALFPFHKAQEQGISIPDFLTPASMVLSIVAVAFVYLKFKRMVLSYLDSFLLFVLAWFFYALGCFFIAISITYIYPFNITFILSFFVLSWLSGYLLFITPMGLGIREVIATASLSFFLPVPIASTIAILTRVGMVLGEILYLAITYIFHKLKNNSRILRLNPYLLIVCFCAIIYFAFFSIYTTTRHDMYISGRFDLGNMTQTVWNTARGNFFTLTNPDGVEQISRLADHSDIILVLFAPLYLIWSDPKVLLIMQSLVIALGGIVVHLLAKEVLKRERISLALSISFYLNFWIHEQNIFDFHAVAVGTTLLLTTFYFLIKKRYVLFSLFLILSVMTKENVFLVASFFGLYLFFKEKKWIIGTLLTIIPTIIFFYLVSKAIPDARGNAHFALSYYSYLGGTTQGIVQNLIFKPQIALGHLFSLSTLDYLHHLLIPTGYLALLSPLYLLFTLPELAIYLLSANPGLRSYQYHYGAIILPFIYISSIYGVKRFFAKFGTQNSEKIVFYYIIFSSLVSLYFYSPLPGMRNADYAAYVTTNSKTIDAYLSIIPKDASVSASNNIGAHLSHRSDIFVVPFAIDTADYVVLYREGKSMKGNVNTHKYQTIIADSKNNFYLYKIRPTVTCPSCNP